jgi:CRISPR-associated protein Csd1
MLLRSLDDLHGQLVAEDRLPATGYLVKRVRFLVDLDTDGQCLSIVDTAPDETVRTVPEVGRTSAVKAFLACDNGQYVLGLPKRNDAKAKALGHTCHTAFLDRLDQAAKALEAENSRAAMSLRAVAQFVSDRDQALGQFKIRGIACDFNEKGELPEASARIAFRVNGVDPTELPPVRNWWAQIANENFRGEVEGLCQVSGIQSRLARIMPGLFVKPGMPQALISANFIAAERYNAKQSGGARIAVPVAIRSHQALNWLLADDHHHRRIGDLTFVWWLATNVAFDPFNLIAQPHPDDVAALLASPWTGKPGLSPSDGFHLLGVSLTEGRVVIRFDHVSTLAEVERRTRRWLELIARPRSDGGEWWPAIWHLAEAAVPPGEGNARKARKDRIVEALARAAVAGTPLPRSLLAALVDRCRAVPVPRKGQNVDWSAIGARLACLNLYVNLKEDRMDEGSVGALCGRILAQLESAQYRALGDINRTIVDRYYAGVSTMPSKVFPGLFKTANAHLAKAGRKQGGKGAQIAISRRLSELCGLMLTAGGFPDALSMEQQADFALGYWDERQKRFQRAEVVPDQANPDETPPEEE